MDFAHLRRMNLNQLITFLVVAEEGSFRAAADVLNISQPALSVQIRQLEEALETLLFRRTSRAMKLTDAGQMLLPVARELANEVETVTRSFRQEAYLKRRTIRVVTIPLFASMLPPVIERFKRRHRTLDVRLSIRTSSDIVRSVICDGDADMGIQFFDSACDDLEGIELYRDEFLAIVPDPMPELQGLDSITLRQLTTFPFLLQPKGSIVRSVIDRHLQAQGLTITALHELRPANGLVALVSAGLGVAILPQATAQFLNLDGCQLICVSDISPRPGSLVRPANRPAAGPVAALHTFLSEALIRP